jgi:hypothetical protein
MGLDMYLYKTTFLSGYEHGKDERFDAIQDAIGIPASSHSPHIEVKVCVGYWRKANAIHAWFVEHVQGGEDECRPHDVTLAKLIELRATCQAVLDDRSKAEELLPPRAGFFFGGTEIDEWYLRDLDETIELINHLEAISAEEVARVQEWMAKTKKGTANLVIAGYNPDEHLPEEHVSFVYQSSW